MPKGSMVIWMGQTFHGVGANESDGRRIGMNIDCAPALAFCSRRLLLYPSSRLTVVSRGAVADNLSFLRQEENQYLACPPHIARTLPDDIRALIGYSQPSPSLGCKAQRLGLGPICLL